MRDVLRIEFSGGSQLSVSNPTQSKAAKRWVRVYEKTTKKKIVKRTSKELFS